MKIDDFEVSYQSEVLIGQHWVSEQARKTVLIMHGAGNSSSRGFHSLQRHLCDHHIDSISFDFLGHGRTGGCVQESSLERRTEQALKVVQKFKLERNLNVIGFSMGAHNALKIAAQISVARIGLAIPAVYSERAEGVAFGPFFSSCIRRYRSWEDSQCFSIIEKFKGKLLVISAEADLVIPAEIPCKLIEKARNCIDAEHHCVRGSGHDLGAHFGEYPESRKLVLKSILRWLR